MFGKKPTGDLQGFVSELTANQSRIRAFLISLMPGSPDVGDVLQETNIVLWKSREARDLFRQLATLHSALEEQGESKAEIGQVALIPMDRLLADQRRRMVRYSLLAAAAVLLVSALGLWITTVPRTLPALADFRLGPDSAFILTHAGEKDPPAGQVLGAGSRLHLSRGTMEAVFESGVRCVLEAPCDLTVLAEDRISVRHGIAWFEVPPPAVGFTVETPQLTVVDLGTAFGVVADVDARHEIHVSKGSVEVSPEYTVLPTDPGRPGRVGILLVGDSGKRGNPLHQSHFENVRLRLTRKSRPEP